MALSGALSRVALKLTAKFGDRVTLRYDEPGKYQTATLTMPTTRKEWPDIPAAVAEVTFSSPDGRLQVGDRRVLIAAGAIVPEDFPNGSWLIVIKGAVFAVKTAKPVEVEGVKVMWDIIARGTAK